MYQQIYGGGGGQGGSFPPPFLPGSFPAMAFQTAAPYGPHIPILATLPVYGQAIFPGQMPLHSAYLPQPIQMQGYAQVPGAPQQALHVPHLRQNRQRDNVGGEDKRDDHRGRHFTEAPRGHHGDDRMLADVNGRASSYDSLGRRSYGETSAVTQSQPGTAERRAGVGGGDAGGESEERRIEGRWTDAEARNASQGMHPSHQQPQQKHLSRWGPQQQQQHEHQNQQQHQKRNSNTPGWGAAAGFSDGRIAAAAASRALGSAAAAADHSAGTSTQAAGSKANNGGYRQLRVYNILSRNIREMVDQLTPTAQEVQEKDQVLQVIRQAAQAAFPQYRNQLRVEPFGSYMCGLGTKSSDIDVVLVGLAEPSSVLGFYTKDERPKIAKLLDRLTPHLRRWLHVSKLVPIRHARVPILKVTTASGISVDISIAGMGGPKAAEYIRQQVSAFPALRPLVLVLKSYMREQDLGELSKGGLSSYGLTYLVMAHLMEEARRGSDATDLGALLHSLLRRYGRSFDLTSMAVSVGDGGLVPRAMIRGGSTGNCDRIATIDPLTGHNITEGAYRSDEVLKAFARADTYLSAWVARKDQDLPSDANILAPLLTPVPDEDAEEYVQEYAPPANGAQLGKRGRSQEMK